MTPRAMADISMTCGSTASNAPPAVRPATPAAMPSFSLAAGTYASAQTLTLSDNTPGAVIYYTTDGTMPNAGSSVYNGQITVSTSETVAAIAVASNYAVSAVATATYTLNLPPAATPTFSVTAWNIHLAANGDDHRHDLQRNHLLHDQRKHAHRQFDPIQRRDHGIIDGIPTGYRRGEWLHQQLGCVCRVHDQPAPANVCLLRVANFSHRVLRCAGSVHFDGDAAEWVRFGGQFCVLGTAGGSNVLLQSHDGDAFRRGRGNSTDDCGQRTGNDCPAPPGPALPCNCTCGCGLHFRLQTATRSAIWIGSGSGLRGFGLALQLRRWWKAAEEVVRRREAADRRR